MAAVLLVLQSRGLLRGQLIKLYILSYLAYRFLTEFIRPEPQVLLGLTGYQWAALALAPVFAWLWCRDARVVTTNRSLNHDHPPLAGAVDAGREL